MKNYLSPKNIYCQKNVIKIIIKNIYKKNKKKNTIKYLLMNKQVHFFET